VEEAARGFYGLGYLAADPLERLVDGVRVGEDVMGGFPIRVLTGGAEARNPEGGRISERSTEIGGGCPVPRWVSHILEYFDPPQRTICQCPSFCLHLQTHRWRDRIRTLNPSTENWLRPDIDGTIGHRRPNTIAVRQIKFRQIFDLINA
jgi:hypothetical protein